MFTVSHYPERRSNISNPDPFLKCIVVNDDRVLYDLITREYMNEDGISIERDRVFMSAFALRSTIRESIVLLIF